MLDQLTERFSGVIKTLRGQARLTESNIQDALREVRIALLEADVALPVVKHFIEQVKTKSLGQSVITSLTPGQAFIGVVHEELTKLMGSTSSGLSLLTQPPAVVLMAGLQGSGKTTSSGKLAKWLKEQEKKKVLLVSCDVYRPAAIEQLKILAHSLEIDFFESQASESPVAIAEKALDYARRHFFDVLIVDTAGRLAVDEAMMTEIKALHQCLNPIETLFVVDAMQGQDAVNTAKAFGETLPLTGVIVTKLDGDARGGVALSVKEVTQKPIKFVGTGEKLTGLEVFHPDRIASRILGMGDVLSLIEDAQRHVDHAEAEKLANKIKKGLDFDLEDFKSQIVQMKKAGGLTAMMDKLPAQLTKNIPQQGGMDDKAMNRVEGIINSMTQQERRFPAIIKASRKKRIAAGSGVSVQEVNRLLNQFEQMQKMMKMMSRGGLSKMMRGMKGMIPGLRG
ncbi:MAG: signal recognition particle protein [Betaproteobacteria bacterium]|nr:signal recognition particle protein [Betaproteobacteria bacterium]MDE2423014.1 signal recognition particle protein [Betaproteobacteria bacterium]